MLRPSLVGENGYRYYDEAALLRLQQILFYRELDLSLDEIRAALDSPDFDIVTALQGHKQALQRRAKRLRDLIRTIDETIIYIQGETTMSDKKLFEAFDEETQQKYEQEASERWDPEVVKASNQRWRNYSDEKKAEIMAEGEANYHEHPGQHGQRPRQPRSAERHRPLASKHPLLLRTHARNPTWSRPMYVDDPRFAAFYENMHPDMPAFLRDAITYYCQEGALAK